MTYVIAALLSIVFSITSVLAIKAEQEENTSAMYINYFVAASMVVLLYLIF